MKPREIALLMIILLALLWGSRAQADVYAEFGGVSHHFDRDAGYRERNPGLGIRWQANDEWGVAALRYRNSLNRDSTAITARWTPIQFAGARIGVVGGVVNGYGANGGGFVPVVVPTAAWQIGPVELGVIGWPSIEKRGVGGGVALSVSLRIW